MFTKKVKWALAATLQIGLIWSIGSWVGWPYMYWAGVLTVVSFLLTLIFLIYDMARE